MYVARQTGRLVAVIALAAGFALPLAAQADTIAASTTLQAAIDMAQPGDTVTLSGTYNEQVVITTDITLTGSGTIIASTSPAITVHNASTTIAGIAVKGSDTQDGIDIINDDATARTVTISGATVTNYGASGIMGRGSGLTLSVSGSTITGAGATSTAQQGIVVRDGAKAAIANNTIQSNDCSSCLTDPSTGAWSTGGMAVLLYAAGTSTVSGNTLALNDFGVQAVAVPELAVTNNAISASASDDRWADIAVWDTDGAVAGASTQATITGNSIIASKYGVLVRDSVADAAVPAVVIHNNEISGDSPAGLYTDVALDAAQNLWSGGYGPTIDSNINNPRNLLGAENTRGPVIGGPAASSVTYRPWCFAYNRSAHACFPVDTSAVELSHATLSLDSNADKLSVDLVFNKTTMNQFLQPTVGITALGSGTTTVSGNWLSGSEWQGTTAAIDPSALDSSVAHLAVYGAEDHFGNQFAGTSSAATLGNDTQGPTFAAAPDIVAEATGPAGGVVTYSEPAASDSSGVASHSCTPASGSPFTFGTTTVTCTATDASSNANTSSVTFAVFVEDTTPPSITPIPDSTAEATSSAGAFVAYTEPAASDVVDGIDAVSCSPAPATFALGTMTVTCSATDRAGNTGSSSFNIFVKDTTAPTITLNGDSTVTLTAGDAYTDLGATATDLVDGDLTASIATTSTVNTASVGTYAVTYSVTDTHGNTAHATRTVNVVPLTHVLSPSAGAHGAISPTTDTIVNDGASQIFDFYPDAHYHIADVLVDGTSVGATTTYKFTNVTAGHTIAVSFAPDTYALVYSAGAHGTLVGTTSQTVAFGGDGTSVTAVPDSGYYFSGWSDGVSTASRTDTNISGNLAATADFAAKLPVTVTVTGGIFAYDGHSHGASATSVTATDGLSTTATSLSYFDNNGDPLAGAPTDAGSYSVAADYAGDATHLGGTSATSSITITRIVATVGVTCPTTHETYDGTAHDVCTAVATSTDGLNEALAVTYDHNINAGTVLANASYAGDANHLSAIDNSSFVIDKADLAVRAMAQNKEFDGTTAATVTLFVAPFGSDDVFATYASANFVSAAVGTGKQVDVWGITLSGADAGNYTINATASTTADIVDTTAPTIATNADITAQATDSSGATVSFSLPTASDLDGIASESCTPASGSTFAVGTTTVVCTAVDLAGNAASSTFMVTVLAAPALGNGHGGSGGPPAGLFGRINAMLPTLPPQAHAPRPIPHGQVLGAEAYQFSNDFGYGSTGQDVTELQNVLIAEGDLADSLNTGYFGPATKAALIAYQKAHGIVPASGFVGPLTRAELNHGEAPTDAGGQGSATQSGTLSAEQTGAILNLLQSFGADQATIANVTHALGQ